MKKTIYILFILIVLSSCQSNKYLRFAIKEKYFLSENEKVLERTKTVITQYDKYNNNLEHQVPLEKCISASNYTIYFGIAINDTPQSMNKVYKQDKSHTIIKHQVDSTKKIIAYNFFVKKDADYNYKLIYKTAKRPVNTVVINLVSKDSSLVGNYFENKKIIFENLKYKPLK